MFLSVILTLMKNQKQAMSKSLLMQIPLSHHRQVTVGVMTRTVSSLTSVKRTKKNKRGSNEQKQGNRKKKKDSRQLSCNSHCSFDRAMRVEETLMQTLAC